MGKTTKKNLGRLVVAALCIGVQTVSAQQKQMDLKQAIDAALASNYLLQADSLNIAVTDLKNKQLAGAYLPQVSTFSRFNYNPAIASQMLPGSVVGQPSKDFVPVQFGTRYDANTGIEANQVIYRKDLLIQMRAAGLYSGIAHTRHRLTKEDVVYQVASNFYSLQSSAEVIRTTRNDYLNLKDVLRIVTAQFENGTVKRVDLESLEITVANKESQLSQLTTQYNEQLDYFRFLLGLPATDSFQISNTVSFGQSLTEGTVTDLTRREDLRLYGQLIKAKEVDIKSVRAERLPSVSSYFRYSNQAQFNSPGKVFDNDYWFKSASVGLNVSVPLFDGYRRKSRLHIAQTELEQLKWQRQEKEQRAVTEWRTSEQKLKNNLQQFATNTKNLELAERVFTTRKSLYGEGVTSLIELLDAERELSQARNLHMQSMINVQQGHLDVYKAKGTLLSEFVNTL